MAREETAILANMCMIYDNDGNVLVENRVDKGWPGLAFPGGHVEPRESFVASVIREVKEETGLDIVKPRLCGIKQWYTEDGARYVVLFFKTNQFSGVLKSSDEGEVFWISLEELKSRKLASGMEDNLSLFEADDLTELYFYDNEDGSFSHTFA